MITTLHAPSRGRLLSLASLALLVACGDGTPVGSEGGATALSVSFAATGTDTTTTAAAGKAIVVGTANDTLEISRVQMVLGNVKLRRAGITACPDSMRVSDDSRRSSDDRGCSRLDQGPMLLDLPLSGTGAAPLAVTIPAGTYHEFEFELDDVSTSSSASAADKAFLVANPDFRNITVRVTGSYKGQAFTFLSRARAEVEFEFEPSLEVQAGVNDNVSVALDLGAWFRDGTSGAVLAPTVANQLRIDQNIMQSFSAFGDRDRNGREDRGRGRGRGHGRSSDD